MAVVSDQGGRRMTASGRKPNGPNHNHHYGHRVDVEDQGEKAERLQREARRTIEKLQHENQALRSTISTATRLLSHYATDTSSHKPRPSVAGPAIDRALKMK
jgi:hypothetical protein